MMMKEFTERTGVTPTPWEYEQIQERYYSFLGNKDEFCKDWLATGGPEKMYAARAERIEELESLLVDRAKDYETTIDRQEDEIKKLKAQLEQKMEPSRYEDLKLKRGIMVPVKITGMDEAMARATELREVLESADNLMGRILRDLKKTTAYPAPDGCAGDKSLKDYTTSELIEELWRRAGQG